MKDRNRQQTNRVTFRLLPEHHERLKSEAQSAGMTVGSLVKYRVFHESAILMDSKPARPSADVKELRKILGNLGKIGSNINQIAHKLNEGNHSSFDQREVYRLRCEMMEIREALMTAMNVSWDKK